MGRLGGAGAEPVLGRHPGGALRIDIVTGGGVAVVVRHRDYRPAATAHRELRPTAMYRLPWRFPVTALTLAPYAMLELPMAFMNHNPQAWFSVRLLAIALLGSASVEALALVLTPRRARPFGGWFTANSRHPRVYVIARLVAVVSMVADVVGAFVGQGTIANQVAGKFVASPVAKVTSLVEVYGRRSPHRHLLSRSATPQRVGVWLATLAGAQVLLAATTAPMAPLLAYLSFVLVTGPICGVLRMRYAMLLVAWPTMFHMRNEIREEQGVAVSSSLAPADRLRLDLQLNLVSTYDVPPPNFVDYLRYGLVPRLLDPDLSLIMMGFDINRYMGGGVSPSYNYLALGNIYFFYGPTGVVV